jgi:hypothetical protein
MTAVTGRWRAFVVLWRAFFAQFFTSETVSSDIQLRQTVIWILAFLLVPGIVLVVQLFFDYQGIVIRAIRLQQFDVLDDTLEWIAAVFVTYSMVTIGFIAVFEWDALTFDRRDAMVLGPLPVGAATIVAAKLAALGSLLLAAAMAVNVPNGIVFAFATGDRLGGGTVIAHFFAHLTATGMAAAFVFATLVIVRATADLVVGPRLAAALGSLLQFTFVVALLSVVALSPWVWDVPHRPLNNPIFTGWLPVSWFTGAFEWVRGSSRPYFMPLAVRAPIATAAVVAGGIAASVAGYHRQLQLAIAPAGPAGFAGATRVRRWLARRLVGRDLVATATSDFILLTVARNRAQKTPIAMNAAVGVACVIAGLVQVRDFAALTSPRTALLWIPLVVAYSTIIGLRAACFVPSELPASWTFIANAPSSAASYWSAVRAAMLAYVLPPMLAVMVVLVPLLGWSVVARHTVFATAVVVVLADIIALTIDYVPFTRPYEAGHAKLRTRWPLYLLGAFVFAVWPAALEQPRIGDPAAWLRLTAAVAAAIVALEITGRRSTATHATDAPAETTDDLFRIRVLDLGGSAAGRM